MRLPAVNFRRFAARLAITAGLCHSPWAQSGIAAAPLPMWLLHKEYFSDHRDIAVRNHPPSLGPSLATTKHLHNRHFSIFSSRFLSPITGGRTRRSSKVLTGLLTVHCVLSNRHKVFDCRDMYLKLCGSRGLNVEILRHHPEVLCAIAPSLFGTIVWRYPRKPPGEDRHAYRMCKTRLCCLSQA